MLFRKKALQLGILFIVFCIHGYGRLKAISLLLASVLGGAERKISCPSISTEQQEHDQLSCSEE